MEKKFVSAIIVAAGNSTRMGTGKPKIFESILGVSSLVYTLNKFNDSELIDEIIVVCKDEHREKIEKLVKGNKIFKFKCFARGGASRQESVFEGIKSISKSSTHVAIHDAARILVTEKIIEDVLYDSFKTKACAAGVPTKDTIKIVDNENFILGTQDRSKLWNIQTPQAFEKNLYFAAMNKAIFEGKNYTDDCQLVENCNQKVHVVMGSYSNLKLTTVDDVPIFEAILKRRQSK